ncbi:hypothetical protein SEA_WHEEHEIM_5 [Streptomyces phage WheeHeim]|uniref:Uncharacterized protein n=1 Tax=Streptomyces phage WheeHeim TaxID=2500797 RepID=A0A411AXU8_9VIRU|nr:hypothetical protein KMD61_gp05 [Streptomyces phage WheeHeim]QAX92914.1 hypothetical protein SEA_WHEEHEIM_5 [Streptomyces phage WheeHeim]
MASGKMTQAEADQQAAEFGEILGLVGAAEGGGFNMPPMPDFVTRLMVQQVSEEFVSVLAQYGYEISIGLLDTGNVAVGLIKSSEKESGPVAGGGYVLAEFSADGIRKMLEMGN